MNKIYGKKIEVEFHEETHSYIEDKNIFNNFNVEYSQANTDEERDEIFKKYNINKLKLKSVTQLLSDAIVFKYDDNLLMNWFNKTVKFGKVPAATPELSKQLGLAIECLNEASKISQREGDIAHEYIQTYIESRVNGTKFEEPSTTNEYTRKFSMELLNPESKLSKLVDSIDELYPYEVPAAFESECGEFKFAGKWDLLFKNSDGDIVILDIKTGSEVKGDKKQKVNLQLNAYNLLIRGYFNGDLIPNKHVCLEISARPEMDDDSTEYGTVTKVVIHDSLVVDPGKFLKLLSAKNLLDKNKKLK